MLFHSSSFLAFFCLVFPVYWAIPHHYGRMLWLLVASCAFYMSWNPWMILLILASASIDYFAALAMERTSSPRVKRWWMVGSVSINLGLLAFFKYANAFLDQSFQCLAWFDLAHHRRTLEIVMPLGMSFYTFETISYIVDVYQGKIRAARSPWDYALFIMFFPHLIAGPIVRPRDYLPQIHRRKRWDWERGYLGCRLILMGFFKKAILADQLAPTVDAIFKDPSLFSTSAIWLGVLAYAIQIYGDFSGYSDMGIGLAHLFGFKLGINFNYPYVADSIADFWRRWHISLSSWLRDYLYIPLGGNRFGTWFTVRNLILVMLLGGLWHGSNWTFAFWGLYHGVLLALHRYLPWPTWTRHTALRPLWILGTFGLVCLGWVFFRAQSFADAATILNRMCVPMAGTYLDPITTATVFLCVAAILAEHAIFTQGKFLKWEKRVPAPLMGASMACVALLACVFFPNVTKAFIYFQF